ncbi:glyoxylase-like metal-dependent hydrolase (beta-lactamase superfamily II) [Roseibium hamelinense]|uniref:Glyoxylase-like metal-dependent hydrolase (Beta-lactamase superfamily II) n=1 Tax=Roseibium hamelinense TaxID=150831 RepID=A0A562SVF4_9HYPH|nr:MBL fold metallo-hydrolase [Roseibium hamelinense]MTI43185.1 MBL fold metallo-hydrolase [Roseibium hamelinense]TWI84766.1 glyoxylase-like metal-dependent hydrolase (beta-lactamase superfamily II) [Roseibium hamelinense]
MSLSRRAFLSGCAAMPFCVPLARFAVAETTIGNGTLTTLSDGHLTLPGSFIFEPMPQDDLAPLLSQAGISKTTLTPDCNVSLYRDGTNTVLFDVGAGPDFQPSAGKLLDALGKVDVAPEDVTHVVFTHGHPDHIWGLLDEFDDPLFYDATYMIGRAEWDYWMNPETVNTIGEARASMAVGAKRRLEAIEDAVEFFNGGDEVLPGIQAVSTPGHTPGHMSFEVRQGSEAALVIGDAIGNHHVAFMRPEWPSGSDQDSDLGAKTRAALFDRIVADDLKIAGFHLPKGGIGHVERNDSEFRFVPEAS